MSWSDLYPVASHIWQSTIFAAVAAFLTLALRKNRAHVRYCVWLFSSIKFLLPLSALLSLGHHIASHTGSTALQPRLSSALFHVSQPLTRSLLLTDPVTQSSPRALLPIVLCVIWATGFVALIYSWSKRWREVTANVKAALPLNLPIGIPVKTSRAFAEPGVYGVTRPVLLLPEGIVSHLSELQLELVVRHELQHVRRRDNLFSGIHMAVEALFWFYPVVWWLGARLTNERERACDEEVLGTGTEPLEYANVILTVCERCVRSSLPFVAGAASGRLTQRIEQIMENRNAVKLTFAKTIVLLTSALTALLFPVALGVIRTPVLFGQSPEIEAASVKSIPDSVGWPPRAGYYVEPHLDDPRRFRALTVLSTIIEWAFDVRDFQLAGAPKWLTQGRFEIVATSERPATPAQMKQLVRTLLADRFRLKLHRDSREMPVYSLVADKSGPKLKATEDASMYTGRGNFEVGESILISAGGTMTGLAQILTDNLDRPVIDKTNLTGRYDFKLTFDPPPSNGNGWVPFGAAIFTPIHELGLRLQPERDSVEILVIDSVERPSAN